MAEERNNKLKRPGTRLNKFIAESGLVSRRGADELIKSGKVMINGKRVFELATHVNTHSDKVVVDGKPIHLESEKIYIMFFKPKGVLTTMEDPEGRPTVADYLTDIPYRVFPVGRLDWDSEGLLLLTNDGEYANKIMHPSEEIPKTYMVKASGKLSDADINKMKTGVPIIGGRVSAREIVPVKRGDSAEKSWYRIVITEGKNRQIRRMFEKLGFDVEKLQRISIGKLELGGLQRGEYRLLGSKSADKVFWTDQVDHTKRKTSNKRSDERSKNTMFEAGSRSEKTKGYGGKPRPKRKTSSKRMPIKN